MKNRYLLPFNKWMFIIGVFIFSIVSYAQSSTNQQSNITSDFWNHVQFGGGLGIGLGNNTTNISIAPSAIYNFNEYVAAGLGLQYSYLKQKDFYNSNLYGGSIIALFNPIENIQLSTELEETSVNTTYETSTGSFKDSFWNTALFIGAGYRLDNVTVGARYNLLFDKEKNVYGEAFMPFVRVYF